MKSTNPKASQSFFPFKTPYACSVHSKLGPASLHLFFCSLLTSPLLLHPPLLLFSPAPLFLLMLIFLHPLPPYPPPVPFPPAPLFPRPFYLNPSTCTHHLPLTHAALSSEMKVLLGVCRGQSVKPRSPLPCPGHDGERVERRQENRIQCAWSEEIVRIWRNIYKGWGRTGQNTGLHWPFC